MCARRQAWVAYTVRLWRTPASPARNKAGEPRGRPCGRVAFALIVLVTQLSNQFRPYTSPMLLSIAAPNQTRNRNLLGLRERAPLCCVTRVCSVCARSFSKNLRVHPGGVGNSFSPRGFMQISRCARSALPNKTDAFRACTGPFRSPFLAVCVRLEVAAFLFQCGDRFQQLSSVLRSPFGS